MKKIISILKNKEIMGRIVFTIAILLIFRIGSAIQVPGVTVSDVNFAEDSVFGLMNLLGGGALSSFSIFALGVSPYITSSIIVELLSMDVLPALAELNKQGQTGRKKKEMTTRYLTLLLGAVQGYGIIKTMENSQFITLTPLNGTVGFMDYAYIVTILVAGGMLVMWLGDQITSKGLGNGISVIIFAGIVSSLPNQFITAFQQWLQYPLMTGHSPVILEGVIRFAMYVVAYLLIICFVVFIELSKRKIPVQHSGKSGSAKMSSASFLPLKINSAGVIPVIFASSILMAPTVIVSFISGADTNAPWLKIFSIN
jgi:preprotein translocase subunit SecY